MTLPCDDVGIRTPANASSTEPTSLDDITMPDEVLAKCFVPYSPTSPPALHGVPITLADPSLPTDAAEAPSRIYLSRSLIERAAVQLTTAFTRPPPTPRAVVDASASAPHDLPVTAICSPHLDSLEVVDAAIQYLAHEVKADIVTIDPADLAAGRGGAYGQELAGAFWTLYEYQYGIIDRKDEAKKKGKDKTKKRPSSPSASDSESSDADSEAGSTTSDPEPEPESTEVIYMPDSQLLASGDAAEADQRADAQLRSATNSIKAYLRMGQHTSLAVKGRRILYLRDFGAFNKALSPMLHALSSALASGSPCLVAVGICPIERSRPPDERTTRSDSPSSFMFFPGSSSHKSPKSANHRQLLEHAGQSASTFMEYLERRYSATWRRPSKRSGRFESLEDTFTALFINCYYGKNLSKKKSLKPQFPEPTKLFFARALRVALSEPLPEALQAIMLRARRRRFVNANIHLLNVALLSLDKVLRGPRSVDDWDALEGSAPAAAWEDISSRIYTKSEQRDIAETIPSPAEVSDVFHSLQLVAETDTAWTGYVKSEMNKQPSDPIVEKVKADRNLGSRERAFLDCIVDPTTIKITFDDVCISPRIIDALRTVVSLPLILPTAYTTGILASESMAGVLLYGPPGTGKTMACRALAGESGVRMVQIQASNIQRSLVGESEQLVHALFTLARKLGPCILFIDELDALFGTRGGGAPVWHTSLITEFMQEMDGLRTAEQNREKGVIVIGATNRPQDLDNAVVRRLPRRFFVGLPTLHERKVILTKYLSQEGPENVDESVQVQAIAARTTLFSGSDLRHLVVSAALAALKDSSSVHWREKGEGQAQAGSSESGVRRITAEHFKQALKEISASCATDMKTLDELSRWAVGVRREETSERRGIEVLAAVAGGPDQPKIRVMM